VVVVIDVLPKDSFEVAMAKNGQPVEAFVSNRPNQRSANALARGDRTGVLITLIPSELNTSSKLAMNFASRSRIKNLTERPRSTRSPTKLRATWVTKTPVGWSVIPRDVHLASRQLDDKEHVELVEQHGVHREEVRGQHALSLVGQELCPGRSAPWSWSKTVLTQDPSHRGGRNANTELSQLALDADTSPSSVLSTQTDDEPDQLFVHGRPAGSLLFSPSPPLALGSFSVPAQQGLGGDQERPPPVSREQTAERGQDGPIRRSIPHACVELALEDMDLVAEHHYLDLLVGLGATCRAGKAQKAAEG
jgi:hypothetical protein